EGRRGGELGHVLLPVRLAVVVAAVVADADLLGGQPELRGEGAALPAGPVLGGEGLEVAVAAPARPDGLLGGAHGGKLLSVQAAPPAAAAAPALAAQRAAGGASP